MSNRFLLKRERTKSYNKNLKATVNTSIYCSLF